MRAELRATMSDVRRLVEGLRPPALDDLGLVGAIEQVTRRLTSGTSTALSRDIPPCRAALGSHRGRRVGPVDEDQVANGSGDGAVAQGTLGGVSAPSPFDELTGLIVLPPADALQRARIAPKDDDLIIEVYNDDAGAGTSYARPTLRWSGPLAVGATVTVRYSVRVDSPDTGDAMMRNVVVTPGGSGIESSGDCPAGADPAPVCRAVTSITATALPAGREPTPPLASTGSDVRLHLLLATLLICAGAAAMVFVRPRRA